MSVFRLRAITDAGTFAIELDANGLAARVRPDTQASNTLDETTFQLAPIDADAVSVISEGATPLRAHATADGGATWVFIDGETFTIDVESGERPRSRRGSSGNEGLSAPMPATVIKVLVEPGAAVHRDDVLLLLEAMKMELPIRAPRDGRVQALHCRPGDLVQPGTALVDLES